MDVSVTKEWCEGEGEVFGCEVPKLYPQLEGK